MTQSVIEQQGMTRAELLALPASVDVVTAGRAFGVGRTTAYALARSGDFPCKIIRAGKAYRVITADLLRVLHVTPEHSDGAEDKLPGHLDAAERVTSHQR